MITKIIPILIASFLVSGCASTMAKTMKNLNQAPRIQQMNHSILKDIREPDQNPIILAVYGFTDQTGQQKPGGAYAEMSKAVTQGSQHLLIKALLDAGGGKWFRVLERDTLQSLLQERKLIRTTRQIQHGDKAKPIGPMLYAGAYLTGAITGYDSNILTGGMGARYLGIGASTEYRLDVVTVVLKLINVTSGEVELTAIVEKSIASAGIRGDVFRYLDTATKLLEAEVGAATNEPVGYAVRKAIEKGVVEIIEMGEEKGLWKYKFNAVLDIEPLDENAEHGPVELGQEITDADPYQFEIDGMKPDRELTPDELEALLKTVDGIPEEVEVEDIEIDKDVVSLIDMTKHHPAWMYDESKDNK